VSAKNQASDPLEAPVRTTAKRTQVNTVEQRMQVETVASEYGTVAQEKLQSSCA
jgi:hypothetical protein